MRRIVALIGGAIRPFVHSGPGIRDMSSGDEYKCLKSRWRCPGRMDLSSRNLSPCLPRCELLWSVSRHAAKSDVSTDWSRTALSLSFHAGIVAGAVHARTGSCTDPGTKVPEHRACGVRTNVQSSSADIVLAASGRHLPVQGGSPSEIWIVRTALPTSAKRSNDQCNTMDTFMETPM